MNQITDDELISFCNFTNLHIEWANIGRRVEKDGTITAYHTIYSFFETEYNGISQREKDGFNQKTKVYIPMTLKDKEAYYTHTPDVPYRENLIRYLEVNKEETLGSIYKKVVRDYKYSDLSTADEDDPNKFHILNEYYYYTQEQFKLSAPVVVEQLERYHKSKNKDKHEYKYLNEWSFIGSYDHHNLCKEVAWLIYDENYISTKVKKEGKLTKKQLLSKFPTRDEVDYEVKNQYAISMIIDGPIDIILSFGNGFLNKPSAAGLTYLYKKTAIGATGLSFTLGIEFDEVGLASEAAKKWFIDNSDIDLQSIDELKSMIKNGKNNDVLPFSKNLKLNDVGFLFSIFKKGNDVVVAIKNSANLANSLNTALNNRGYPKELFLYDMFFEKLISTYGRANITITGYENGGKLAELLGTYYNLNTRVFYEKEHSNMGNFVNFQAATMVHADQSLKFHSGWEIVNKATSKKIYALAAGAIAVIATIATGGVLALPLASFMGTLLSTAVLGASLHQKNIDLKFMLGILQEYNIVNTEDRDEKFNWISKSIKEDNSSYNYKLSDKRNGKTWGKEGSGLLMTTLEGIVSLKLAAFFELLYLIDMLKLVPINSIKNSDGSYTINILEKEVSNSGAGSYDITILSMNIKNGDIVSREKFIFGFLPGSSGAKPNELSPYLMKQIPKLDVSKIRPLYAKVTSDNDRISEGLLLLLQKSYDFQQNWNKKTNYRKSHLSGGKILVHILDIKILNFSTSTEKFVSLEKNFAGLELDGLHYINKVKKNIIGSVAASANSTKEYHAKLFDKLEKEGITINQELVLV